jgi:lysophospholipase L1-like esterase
MAKSGTYDEKVATRGTYQKNITAIIDQATSAGVKPVMLTATVIQENLNSKENGLLAPYNDFLRKFAKEKKVPMADLFAMFEERIKAENKPNVKVLTSDGVHMNGEGNKLMAIGVLKAFGLNEAELDKAKASWPALEVAAAEFAKKQAEARAKAAAGKAKAAPATKK